MAEFHALIAFIYTKVTNFIRSAQREERNRAEKITEKLLKLIAIY